MASIPSLHPGLALCVSEPGCVKVTIRRDLNHVLINQFEAIVCLPESSDQAKPATVILAATDVADNVRTCDPTLVSVHAGPGKPVSEVVTGVAQAESTISIYNSTPGLKQLDVTVNGELFRVTHLHDGEVRSIDVASALTAGDNTIRLTPRGHSGSAEVLISDAGRQSAAQHGTKHQITERQEQQEDSASVD